MDQENNISEIQAIKKKQGSTAFFGSATSTFQFLAAIFTTTSFAILLPAIIGTKAVAATSATAAVAGTGMAGGLSFTAACAALTTIAPVGLALLGAAALVTALGSVDIH